MTAQEWIESGEKVHMKYAYDWMYKHNAYPHEFHEDYPQYEKATYFLASDVFEWLGY